MSCSVGSNVTNRKLAFDFADRVSFFANLSGRGDKDIFTVAEHLGVEL